MAVQGHKSFGSDAASNFVFPFTLQQLITLRTLAMSQTLDEAAAALSMSETNVRTTISKLEKDLAVELFQAQVATSPGIVFSVIDNSFTSSRLKNCLELRYMDKALLYHVCNSMFSAVSIALRSLLHTGRKLAAASTALLGICSFTYGLQSLSSAQFNDPQDSI